MQNNLRIIGRREFVKLPQLELYNIEAKIDTGAYTSALHCDAIWIEKQNNHHQLQFTILETINGITETKKFSYNIFKKKRIKNSFGEDEERYIIKTLICIGHKKIIASLSLTNRDKMRYPMLIGRKALKGKFLIDVNNIHTKGIKLSKYIKTISK
ncbi:MAG: ATP-dependent zinc protease [Bacteroidetes bacterium]|nr:ATP-dependent zinc protease [Bacteroidota bacterium]